ncbi:hypothetical protein POM88_043099 [Heracleum sosnowskyi]|uniref:Uncharacterized protein n=1 Tax=Heracleum sosnowskyi TaxID=360622 RepID=A0AAD8H0E0_9APIA|nr:hypothetical protein POM88_043099 [Heracleum sosnowskyi]
MYRYRYREDKEMKIVYRNPYTNPNYKKRIYHLKKDDISRVPQIFYKSTGRRFYPRNDLELQHCLMEDYSKRSIELEIYYVVPRADKVTEEECVELLKGIGCESRFIACSVEEPSLFFAELNEDDATRLKASGGIKCTYPRRHLSFLL